MLDFTAWKMGLDAYREGDTSLQANPFTYHGWRGNQRDANRLELSWTAGWLAGMHAEAYRDGTLEIVGFTSTGVVMR